MPETKNANRGAGFIWVGRPDAAPRALSPFNPALRRPLATNLVAACLDTGSSASSIRRLRSALVVRVTLIPRIFVSRCAGCQLRGGGPDTYVNDRLGPVPSSRGPGSDPGRTTHSGRRRCRARASDRAPHARPSPASGGRTRGIEGTSLLRRTIRCSHDRSRSSRSNST
jgi:hypothetical protein